jgi:hypothetical protein
MKQIGDGAVVLSDELKLARPLRRKINGNIPGFWGYIKDAGLSL